MKKFKFDDIKYVLISVVTAFLLFGLVFYLLKFYPFGDRTMMKVDLFHQYGPFHEEFRKKLLSGESLFYSWEGGLGKEMITQIAYYTSSPISFLMLLFPQENMPEAMALFVLIKVGAAAGFFSLYLKLRFKRNDPWIVMFSIMYAFISYISCYYWNIMWLDAVALFPMVAYGIEELVHEGRHLIYGIFLMISILVNFYIAFIVCVFSVLYFAVILFSNYSIKKDKDIIISRIIRFVITSGLAGGICMFLAIPTAVALGRTATSDSSFPNFKIYENIYQIITNHFLGARPVVLGRNEDLPNVYSGVLTMILIPLFFMNKRIEAKEKVLFGLFIAFMIVCSCVNTFDYLIHGAHFPSNLPHRYTFIYSFVLIVLAYRAFIDLKGLKLSNMAVPFAFYTAVILITEKLIVENYDEVDTVLTDDELKINIILMLVYMIIIYIIAGSKKGKNNYISLLLCGIVFTEAVYSCYVGIKPTEDSVPNSRGAYVKYLDGTNEVLKYIEENDKDEDKFFRQEFRRFTTINEGSLYHFNGFSQFSSLAYGATSALIGDLGVAATGNSYRLYDPTPLVEDMFNLKYIMNKDGTMNKPGHTLLYQFDGVEREPIKEIRKVIENGQEVTKEVVIDDMLKTDSGSVYLYKNDEYLPLGFMVKKDIEQWDTKNKNPFKVQNEFAKIATGEGSEILSEIKIKEPTYENIDITKKEEENNYYKYSLKYPSNLNAKPSVKTSFINEKEQNVFFYVDAGNAKRVKYYFNNKDEDRELSAGKSLFDCGIVPANTEITVEFTLDRKGEFEKTYRKDGNFKIFAAGFNDDEYKKVFDKLNEHTMTVNEYSETNIKATVDGGDGGILFTSIPYDKGWKVTVDGEERETKAIAGEGLIGIDMESGEHQIEFNYVPDGFGAGCAVSTASLALFIGYSIFLKRKDENTETAEMAKADSRGERTENSPKEQKNEETKKVSVKKGRKKKKKR